MKYILLQKKQAIYKVTKSLNQNPNIKAQTSDKNQPSENYENSAVVFDDILLAKQASNVDLFFSTGHHKIIVIYYKSQSYFYMPKKNLYQVYYKGFV